MSDIDAGIEDIQKAIALTPDADLDKVACLANLGVSQHARFVLQGDMRDVNAAISNLQSAADQMVKDKVQQSCFVGLGEQQDIEAVILNHQAAVELTADDDVKKPVYLENLTATQSRRPQ
jgi:hypothetical protein